MHRFLSQLSFSHECMHGLYPLSLIMLQKVLLEKLLICQAGNMAVAPRIELMLTMLQKMPEMGRACKIQW